MPGYPLIFRTTHLVQANAFQALIRVDGRLLMTHEEGEWVCSGVEPGGLVECGVDPTVAYEVFRTSLRNLFDDVAHGSKTLDEFRSSVESVFRSDDIEAALWQEALLELRAKGAAGVGEEFKGMARVEPRESKIEVTEVSNESRPPMDPAKSAAKKATHEVSAAARSRAPSMGMLGDDLALAELDEAA